MTTRTFTPSRRSALQLFGASAALATPGIGLAANMAASTGAKPILSLNDVPIAWPVYHRLAAFGAMPEAGDRVSLERDVPHPSEERGIAVRLSSGDKLGYITNQHHAALDWALQRAGRVDARIEAINEPVVRGKTIPGWGAFRISVKIYEGAAFV